MSRRPPTAADTAERNRAALKALVKLESNKSCGDCKRNKHPRWASWNLGVFVCIRCSGIHRSLGVHISKVKSVDLDSWTDEQLASMVKWGNKRANRYWEDKLAEGHVPNESKIENFIRTKYDSRRWVMDGPMPDPSTLDAGDDDDVPLKVVQERARVSSGTQPRNGGTSVGRGLAQPPQARPQEVDLFGDMNEPTPARPNTTEPAVSRAPPPPKAPAAAPKPTRPGESLLGLDFFGGAQSAPPARPSSTGPNTGGAPGRTDLKQSILSLYASKPAAPPQQPTTSNMNAFGGMQSPPPTASPQQSNAQALGGLGDAFGSLSFTSPSPQQAAKALPFSGLTSPTGHSRAPSGTKSSLSGGSFFDMKPAPPPKNTPPPPQPTTTTTTTRKESFGGDFGDFSSSVTSPVAYMAKSPPAPASGGMGDLFDMASPTISAPAPKPAAVPQTAKSPAPVQASNYAQSAAFNLSQPSQPSPPQPVPAAQATSGFGNISNMDAWGSNDAWGSSEPVKPPVQQAAPIQTSANSTFKPAATPAAASKIESPFESGWGDPEPAAPAAPANTAQSAGGWNVQQDDEFGGWSHASPVATTSEPKQGGVGGNADDLFGNLNYRLGGEHLYPQHIHDVLSGYDWVKEHLLSKRAISRAGRSDYVGRIAVCGELIGGGLATMLAMTECRAGEAGVVAAAVSNPLVDWVGLDEGQESELRSAAVTPYRLDVLRRQLFGKAEHYFDPFVSPLLFFRSPGQGVPQAPSGVPSDDLEHLAYLERQDFFRQQLGLSAMSSGLSHNEGSDTDFREKPTRRKASKRYPSKSLGLRLPLFNISSDSVSPFAEQADELASELRKSFLRQAQMTDFGRKILLPDEFDDVDEDDQVERKAMLAEANGKVLLERTQSGLGVWDGSKEGVERVKNVAAWLGQKLVG